jgi:hypothetical protein
MGRKNNRDNRLMFPDLIYVCKKTKYATYPIAYAYASVADAHLTIYYCDTCKAYHLSSNTD